MRESRLVRALFLFVRPETQPMGTGELNQWVTNGDGGTRRTCPHWFSPLVFPLDWFPALKPAGPDPAGSSGILFFLDYSNVKISRLKVDFFSDFEVPPVPFGLILWKFSRKPMGTGGTRRTCPHWFSHWIGFRR